MNGNTDLFNVSVFAEMIPQLVFRTCKDEVSDKKSTIGQDGSTIRVFGFFDDLNLLKDVKE